METQRILMTTFKTKIPGVPRSLDVRPGRGKWQDEVETQRA